MTLDFHIKECTVFTPWRQVNKVTIYIYVIICHYDTRLSYKGVYRFHSMETSE